MLTGYLWRNAKCAKILWNQLGWGLHIFAEVDYERLYNSYEKVLYLKLFVNVITDMGRLIYNFNFVKVYEYFTLSYVKFYQTIKIQGLQNDHNSIFWDPKIAQFDFK